MLALYILDYCYFTPAVVTFLLTWWVFKLYEKHLCYMRGEDKKLRNLMEFGGK